MSITITKEQILDAVAKMSLIDIVELVSMMEKKFGVSASNITTNNTIAKSDDIVEEQTEFKVILNSIGSNKISVIKAVRVITGLGLKDAKDLVESAPVTIKEGINKEDSNKIKKTLEDTGASVEIK